LGTVSTVLDEACACFQAGEELENPEAGSINLMDLDVSQGYSTKMTTRTSPYLWEPEEVRDKIQTGVPFTLFLMLFVLKILFLQYFFRMIESTHLSKFN
jgi:hypothetical protein